MTRKHLIEQIIRAVYGDQPRDDSTFTDNYVNQLICQGQAIAAKQNYKDAIALDGVGYLNNSFYVSFKGLAITKDEQSLWKATLPQIPVGVGMTEGISGVRLKKDGKISLNGVALSESQKEYADQMRQIPDRFYYYPEGGTLFIKSSLQLNEYTATVTMVSAGDSTNLGSTLNVPDDYIPIIIDYVTKLLVAARRQPQDVANDGADIA